MAKELIAGRLSDSGYTDKISGTTDSKIYFGTFVTATYEDGFISIKPSNQNVTGLVITLDHAVEYAVANSCVPVLRNGRAYALVKKGETAELNQPAKVDTDGIIATAGTAVPNVIIIGEVGNYNNEYDAVEVQVNVATASTAGTGE